jgi:hypothetical protein
VRARACARYARIGVSQPPENFWALGPRYLYVVRLASENDYVDGLCATTDVHGASLWVVGHQACRLGGCHTNDHLARSTADASRAVILTTSPSAVKSSSVVSSRVAPTNASPVWTAVPTGMDTDVVVACAARSARSICGCHCCGRVMRPADAPEEEPNNLGAYELRRRLPVDESLTAF